MSARVFLLVSSASLAAAACRDSPPTSAPVDIPEVNIDDEHVAAVLPPMWQVGQTWIVETESMIWDGVMRLDIDRRPLRVLPYRGLAHYRVAAISDEIGIVVATTETAKGSTPAQTSRWELAFSFEPWIQVARIREGNVGDFTPRGSNDLSAWMYKHIGMYQTEVMYGVPLLRDAPGYGENDQSKGTVVIEGEMAVWRWDDFFVEQVDAVRTVRWRPGDPWWALAEGLDLKGRAIRGKYVPARGRLVAIDGVPIEPLPWTE